MRRISTLMVFLAAFCMAGPHDAAAADQPPGREFTATARVDTPQGSRQMPVTLVVNRFASQDEALRLRKVLEEGGQWVLLDALRGRRGGTLRLGALQIPISVVFARPTDGGYRYVFLSARRIRFEEQQEGSESLDYPFGVAVFEIGRFGDGEGSLYPAAALAMDEDGRVRVEQFEIDPGELADVKMVR